MTRPFLILMTALLVSAGSLAAKSGKLPTPIVKGKVFELGSKGGPTCNELDPDQIACDSSVDATLLNTDCLADDDTLLDFYEFAGDAGDEVLIDLTSDEFDTFLFLLQPDGQIFAFDDDGGTGANSRIAATLDQTGSWFIVANNYFFQPSDPGNYTLTLSCNTPACRSDMTAMCLNQERFRVEVDWTDFEGVNGQAQVVNLPIASDDSGVFYFFSADNWEMLVKVLDGCAINNHFWVFAAATTNVEYTLRVTDTLTGQVSEYVNPAGVSSAAVTDTGAFMTCTAP